MTKTPSRSRQQIAPTPLAYRIPQAAETIGVSRSTMWALIAKGDIEARKIGAVTVIRHEDLKAFIDRTPVAVTKAVL